VTPKELLSCAMDIGEQMHISGAEIGRVEDSIKLICMAYGCRRADVFTITTSMLVTIEWEDGTYHTQSRRITGGKTDLERLHQLNSLSRHISAHRPSWESVQRELQSILVQPAYPFWIEMLASSVIAGAFAIFFGGSWADGLVAAVLGGLLHISVSLLRLARMNQILTNVAASFLVSAAAIAAAAVGLGRDPSKIIIGNIMLLIPGIALTNSLRDMISGDIISGLLRFLDAILGAVAIAAGYILAARFLGGVL
jgi:uncharacterized membrane protein YjjP (DUF1212 family)